MKPVSFTAEFTKPTHCIETTCKLSEAFQTPGVFDIDFNKFYKIKTKTTLLK